MRKKLGSKWQGLRLRVMRYFGLLRYLPFRGYSQIPSRSRPHLTPILHLTSHLLNRQSQQAGRGSIATGLQPQILAMWPRVDATFLDD